MQRPVRAVFGNAALLVTFSVLHIAHCSGSCSRIVDGPLTLNLMIVMFTFMLEEKEIERLNIAYRKTLRLLHLVDRNDPIAEIIAMKVIEVGKSGIRDPKEISEIAVEQFSCMASCCLKSDQQVCSAQKPNSGACSKLLLGREHRKAPPPAVHMTRAGFAISSHQSAHRRAR
jgi:hypothetical protein